jgi:DNA mismatch endonuclease (patch repair protein)
MADSLTPEQRSQQMARVRSKNTRPEMSVRRGLHARGLRFRLHCRDLPGKPDIVFAGARVAVFVHGCFFHGCSRCDHGLRRPKTNPEFWQAKIDSNRTRDVRNVEALEAAEWRVEVVWECDVRKTDRLATALDRIEESVRGMVA